MKKLYLIWIILCTFISFGLQAQEEVPKTYLNPHEIIVSSEGIFIVDEIDYQPVEALYFDEHGIYVLSPSYVIRCCTRHMQVCSICGGCSAVNCLKKCPRPGKCR